jgi:heptaprenyl diphosphate synthase
VIRRIGPSSSSEEVAHVLELVKNSDALARTEAVSQDYLSQAAAIVQQLSSFPAHADLEILLEYFAGRDR